MTERHHISTLPLEETSVCTEWTYDKSKDRVFEPKQYDMCVMIRGLAARWNQLIFSDFDVSMTKDVLFHIIEKVEAAGFLVIAMINDLGPTNIN